MPGTDSDAVRCARAVAMASHVVEGPDAVAQFVRAGAARRRAVAAPNGPREQGAKCWTLHRLVDGAPGDPRRPAGAGSAARPVLRRRRRHAQCRHCRPSWQPNGPERVLQAMDVWTRQPDPPSGPGAPARNGPALLIVPTSVTFNDAMDLASPDAMSPRRRRRLGVQDSPGATFASGASTSELDAAASWNQIPGA